jgi:CRP/FNR family transcriptional regulator
LIYVQDDPADYLYFLLDGRVNIFLVNSQGEFKTLAIHEPGSFFGETPFFGLSNYFTSAVALANSLVLGFNEAGVKALFAANPQISMLFLRSLGRKIRLLTFHVESFTFLTIEKRVGAMLLSLFENFSCLNHETPCLTIQVTDEELARLVGTRREAVTKAITKLKNMKFLHKEKRTLYFDDLDGLKKFITYDG